MYSKSRVKFHEGHSQNPDGSFYTKAGCGCTSLSFASTSIEKALRMLTTTTLYPIKPATLCGYPPIVHVHVASAESFRIRSFKIEVGEKVKETTTFNTIIQGQQG